MDVLEIPSYSESRRRGILSNIVEAGRNIVLLRKALNMKQEEVAFLSNLSVSRLQDIECGCPNVTFDTLTCISKTLGVDFRVLDIFLQSDAEILSAFHSQKPQLSGLDNGTKFSATLFGCEKSTDGHKNSWHRSPISVLLACVILSMGVQIRLSTS